MAVVAGVDFGALSFRVTLLDSAPYRLRTALAAYPLRGHEDLDRAIDHVCSVAKAAQPGIAETDFAAGSKLCLPDKTFISRLAADLRNDNHFGPYQAMHFSPDPSCKHGRSIGNVPPAMLGIAASMRTTSHLERTIA